MSTARVVFLDGIEKEVNLQEEKNANVLRLTIAEELDYTKIDYIDFDKQRSEAKIGDEGYFLALPVANHDYVEKDICGHGFLDYGLTCFKDREDVLFVNHRPKMYVYGVQKSDTCFLGIVTGLKYQVDFVLEISGGKYYSYPRFLIEGENPYEPISVELHFLEGKAADYNGMAREYRSYQLAHGCVSIKERAGEHLKYSAESMYVRVRNAWKPVPTPVLEQTEENEPEVFAACDFERTITIMEQFKKHGIDKAEFCLVGFNKSGHDGRWPQILPVEEKLGGEEGLKKVIAAANRLGYKITCHTNSTDAYSIANNFDIDDMMVDKNGKVSILAEKWSGGRAYNICPKQALKLAKETLPAVRDLGFSGMHYIDVISILPPKRCYHPAHPLSFKEGVDYSNEILDYAASLFGGISSESVFDHSIQHIDMGLYASFSPENDDHFGLVDKVIPFWQLVYHGIVLDNPYTRTVNAAISKNPDNMLKLIEFGGRPVIYYNSRFVDEKRGNETNWMGDIDFVNDTDEHLIYGIEKAAKQYQSFKEMAYLQYEFMQEHKEIADGIYAVTYSDGTVVTVDYNKGTYTVKK